jgi:glycosyltransferase involved in cell wall biosynthesis
MEKGVTVLIPARNEGERIGQVIRGIRKVSKDYKIIVIDDGSADRTGEVAESLGCKTYRLEKNMGKGFACRLGVEKSRTERIVFIDADMQFYPEEIPKLAERLDECDIVLGARVSREIPIQRRISNSFARRMLNSIAKSKHRDVLCGFRAVKKESFRKLGLEKNRYEFESEMLIKAARMRMRICEVPVRVRYFQGYPGIPASQSIRLALYLIRQKLSP